MCDMVQFMIGKGRTPENTAELMEISVSTVNRIRAAGYSAERYAEMKEERRQEDIRKREQAREKFMEETKAAEEQRSEQVPGQLMMQFPGQAIKRYDPVTKKIYVKDENGEREMLPDPEQENAKMIRFQAAMTDKILMKLSQLNDNVCQLLRAVRKE